jgi:cholesterol transport system auxiliary component
MMSRLACLFLLLLCGCATHRALPVRYDLDGVLDPMGSQPALNVTIAVPPIASPAWLRSTALLYRLRYEAPADPRAYAQSEWIAPPGELLTQRLRESIATANRGVTLEQLDDLSKGYRLEVSLESFVQVFTSPDHSRCVVAFRATLLSGRDHVLAQRTFHAEQVAPRPDAAGGVEGLVAASDANFGHILAWLRQTLATRAPVTAAVDTPRTRRTSSRDAHGCPLEGTCEQERAAAASYSPP